MEQSVINRIRDKAVSASKKCSCEDILIKSGMSYRRRGNQLYFFCPNCDREQFLKDRDERLLPYKEKTYSGADVPDHCSVNLGKNMYFCFTCTHIDENGKRKSAGGGPAKLYSIIYKTPYIDSALILAEKSGALTEEEVKLASSSADAIEKFKKASENIEAYEEHEARKEAEMKAPSYMCDLVYRTMLEMKEFSLTPEHLQYLRTSRCLSDKEIMECQFFTYHSTFSFEELVARCRAKYPAFTHRLLYGVPGFYFETKGENKGVWHFKYPMPNCIGIPLKNARGEIVALQMRNMDANAKNKYFYVSSKYESRRNKAFGYGSSPGSPACVCYPEILKIPTFYIGEGFFKMKEVAKEGAVSFSVQGVNNIGYVVDEVREVMKNHITHLPTTLTGSNQIKLVIVFDADMYSNIQVLEAGLRASVMLEENFPKRPISFLLWKAEYGKGFDDMKFNCLSRGIDYRSLVRNVPKDVFISIVRESINESDSIYMGNHPNMSVTDRQTAEYGNILFDILYNKKISRMLP